MAEAQRIPAAEKAPGDFIPPAMQAIVKKFVAVVVKRKDGSEEGSRVILRPGDMLTVDGKTVAEG